MIETLAMRVSGANVTPRYFAQLFNVPEFELGVMLLASMKKEGVVLCAPWMQRVIECE